MNKNRRRQGKGKGKPTVTGASTRCTLLSSTRISMALRHNAFTSPSFKASHRRSCSIWRSKSDIFCSFFLSFFVGFFVCLFEAQRCGREKRESACLRRGVVPPYMYGAAIAPAGWVGLRFFVNLLLLLQQTNKRTLLLLLTVPACSCLSVSYQVCVVEKKRMMVEIKWNGGRKKYVCMYVWLSRRQRQRQQQEEGKERKGKEKRS